MEDKKMREILTLLSTYTSYSREKEGSSPRRVASDGSRPSPSVKEEEVVELPPDFSLDYNLTVRLRMNLDRRQISLLLAILNYQACHFGLNFGMYLSMEFLSSLLLGTKIHPSEIKDKFVRDNVFVSQVVLLSMAERSWNLIECRRIPQRVVQGLVEGQLLMSRRTFGSRFSTWRPERFLEIRAVPVNSLYDRQKGNSIRYSSYTKGYGESHPSTHRVRTKPSFELDGEKEERDFIKIDDLHNLLILTQLEIWTKYHKKEGE